MLKLGTIEEEAAECRKRFAGVEVGLAVVHCHHEIPIEILTESAENRIKFILSQKNESEQALRLRLFAPIIIPAKWQEAEAKCREAYAKKREADAKWQEADAKWEEAVSMISHSEICPLGSDCPWDGKTIFAKPKEEHEEEP